MAIPIKSLSISRLVDRLGNVKADIADLEKLEDKLRQVIIDAGVTEAEGKLFRCTVSNAEYTMVQYKEVIGKLPMTPRLRKLLKQFSKTEQRTVVKVVSR